MTIAQGTVERAQAAITEMREEEREKARKLVVKPCYVDKLALALSSPQSVLDTRPDYREALREAALEHDPLLEAERERHQALARRFPMYEPPLWAGEDGQAAGAPSEARETDDPDWRYL